MKLCLCAVLLAIAMLAGGTETVTAQPTALVNPPACKLDRCLRYCVHWRTQRNCHRWCRRCT